MKKILLSIVVFCLFVSSACADTVWVLCQPDSYVNVRPFPSRKQEANGYMECGWKAETDGESKNGYLCVENIPNEDNGGWISKGYLVYSEPAIRTFKTNIYAEGRVACWRSIGGDRRCWADEGEEITVYAVSEEWSVTNKGFIKTMYLGVDYGRLVGNLAASETNPQPAELYWEDEEG